MRLTFHLIAHTHWDREWYLPAPAFTARLVPVIDDLLDALERDPRFRSFLLDGQTILLEDYLRVRPDAEDRVRTLVAAGRLQAGPWYVLADELTPSGESLLRNLLIGARQSARLGGRLDVMYSPDAFGHPAAWPAIAAEFGFAHGVLWRGLAPRAGEGDLFRWRAPGGAEVLLYHLPRQGYEAGAALQAEPAALRPAWRALRNELAGRARSPHVAVFVGADHHAAHPAVGTLRDLIAELEPGHEVRVSRLDEFLAAAAGEAHDVPVIDGELRWSYGYTWTLQGVHGTRLPLKRRNARTEFWLERVAEPLAALAAYAGGRDRAPLLRAAWQTLVRSHFHDSICGCSHDAVAAAVDRRLGDVDALAREIARGAAHDLSGHDPDAARDSASPRRPALLVWNPLARGRSAVCVADITFFRHDVLVGPPGDRTARVGTGYAPFALLDPGGASIPVQVIEHRQAVERIDAARHYPDADAVDVVRVAFRMREQPGLSVAALALAPRAAGVIPAGVTASAATLRNERIEVSIARSGTLTLRDLETGECYRDLLTLTSEGDAGDTYTFAPSARDRVRRSRAPVAVRLLATGPLVAIADARWDDLSAGFHLRVALHAGDPFVRITLDVDNRAENRRLRMRLPLGLAGTAAAAGAPFGLERRLPMDADVTGWPSEHPVPTAPAQRLVAAARGNRGLVFLAPGHCEYEWTTDGDLSITLLRSVGQLSLDDLPTRPGHAGWPTAVPRAQCPGRDRVEFALAPVTEHEAGSDAMHRLWEEAFLAPQPHWLRDAGTLDPRPVSVNLEGEGLVLSAVKPAEQGDGLVLRCYNVGPLPRWGAWRVEPVPRAAWRVRADEEIAEAVIVAGDGTIRFRAEAHEIVTLRVA